MRYLNGALWTVVKKLGEDISVICTQGSFNGAEQTSHYYESSVLEKSELDSQ